MKITGELRGRQIEREQWSDLNRHRSKLLLFGRGEGYVEELYFGKGFSTPPTFSFSAVFENEKSLILSYSSVAPRGSLTREVDLYGMGNDSMSFGGLIEDPGFESQAKYHLLNAALSTATQLIPTCWTVASKEWTYRSDWINSKAYLPIRTELETSFTDYWAPKYLPPQSNDHWGPHRWLQTDDVRELWSVVRSDSHDLGVGEAGQASATMTLGPTGISNWLIPIDSGKPFDTPINDPVNVWRIFRSVREAANTTNDELNGGGIKSESYPPPYIEGFDGFLYAKADAPIKVESQAVFSCENYNNNFDSVSGVDSGLVGKRIFDDSAYYPGDRDSRQFSYREIASVRDESTASTLDWERIGVDLPYAGWRAWPNALMCLENKLEPWDTYWTLKFRVKGTPGTVVNLDNIFITRQMRNLEVPILTVGVDEWIRDESGVYIGARLWVKMGTPTGSTCDIPTPGWGGGT